MILSSNLKKFSSSSKFKEFLDILSHLILLPNLLLSVKCQMVNVLCFEFNVQCAKFNFQCAISINVSSHALSKTLHLHVMDKPNTWRIREW